MQFFLCLCHGCSVLAPCCRHPDKNGNSEESNTKFQMISAAYARLTSADASDDDLDDLDPDRCDCYLFCYFLVSMQCFVTACRTTCLGCLLACNVSPLWYMLCVVLQSPNCETSVELHPLLAHTHVVLMLCPCCAAKCICCCQCIPEIAKPLLLQVFAESAWTCRRSCLAIRHYNHALLCTAQHNKCLSVCSHRAFKECGYQPPCALCFSCLQSRRSPPLQQHGHGGSLWRPQHRPHALLRNALRRRPPRFWTPARFWRPSPRFWRPPRFWRRTVRTAGWPRCGVYVTGRRLLFNGGRPGAVWRWRHEGRTATQVRRRRLRILRGTPCEMCSMCRGAADVL
jgi:hypothetical protein